MNFDFYIKMKICALKMLKGTLYSATTTTTTTDADQCFLGTHTCHVQASCSNTDDGFDCECNSGFFGNGTTCEDVNECVLGTNDCDAHATCSNTIGSYSCTCDFGYDSDETQCSAPALLVLSTFRSRKEPMLFDFEGKSRLGRLDLRTASARDAI